MGRRCSKGSSMANIGKAVLGSIPHLLLACALLLYLPWALGVPGTSDAPYADGWYLGFYAINIFIAFYAILGVLGVIARLGWLPIAFRWIRAALWFSTGFFGLLMPLAIYQVFN